MMLKIKLIIAGVIAAIIIGLGITIWIQSAKINRIEEDLSTAIANNKAYELENGTLKDSAYQFKMTVEQLNYSKDSLTQKLNNARKELKIKDKDIKALQYLASQNQKKDSVFVRDTIFRDSQFKLDTLIKDDWSKLALELEYPNKIVAEYSFKNETTIITSVKKETINPPKKCWIARLFQKKHKVVVVEVHQENPYCENEIARHIEIIK